jgi:hypothetical protein
MHGTLNLPVQAGQVSLHDLAAEIRRDHAEFTAALAAAHSIGGERAVAIANKLEIARKATGHGRWSEFVRSCGFNERTGRQYLQLAKLAKTVPGTVLAGLSIKAAIRLLSPPKPPKPVTPKPSATKAVTPMEPRRKAVHTSVIEVWMTASPADRTKAVDAIGLNGLLAAIPEAWLPLLEQRLAERHQAPAPKPVVDYLLPADGSIPTFLIRPAVKVEPDDDEPPPDGPSGGEKPKAEAPAETVSELTGKAAALAALTAVVFPSPPTPAPSPADPRRLRRGRPYYLPGFTDPWPNWRDLSDDNLRALLNSAERCRAPAGSKKLRQKHIVEIREEFSVRLNARRVIAAGSAEVHAA